jgi:hypothetical protein
MKTTTMLMLAIAMATAPAAVTTDDVVIWNARTLTVITTNGQNGIVQTRSLAMVHAAIHDALNAIQPRYERYLFQGSVGDDTSAEAAIASAAYHVLAGLIPGYGSPEQRAAAQAQLQELYLSSLASIPDGPSKTAGITVGASAATAILEARTGDGASLANTSYIPLTGPGFWQPTPNPVPPNPLAGGVGLAPALLPRWGDVSPFVLHTGAQFRPDGPPSLTSEQYTTDYNEVKSIGAQFSSTRTAEQSEIARFWYEGSQVGWNRIARVVAAERGLDPWEQGRLFALVNFAMADGFIAGFNARYTYHFWRPVTAIRAGDTDDNPWTEADPSWSTYLNTPAIPDYPSTHSVLGAAAAEVLEQLFADDQFAFTTTSGAPFAGITRSFTSFTQAALENADSRVFAGIHFRTACRDGLWLGGRIGMFAVRRYLKPAR